MTHDVTLSSKAKRDMREVCSYIRQHGPADPKSWKEGLVEQLIALETMPRRFTLAPENNSHSAEIRQATYGGVRILFAVFDTLVLVISIRHSARLPIPGERLDDAVRGEPELAGDVLRRMLQDRSEGE